MKSLEELGFQCTEFARKLDVHNRMQAVARARALGILPTG
jgi:DNA-binding NarL/FixJ family response regulator